MTATKKQSLTQEQLIKEVAQATSLSQDKVKHVLRQTAKTITDHTSNNQIVPIPDLGRFEKKTRSARTGINPKTKERITIPAKHFLSFRPSKLTQETINNQSESNENG